MGQEDDIIAKGKALKKKGTKVLFGEGVATAKAENRDERRTFEKKVTARDARDDARRAIRGPALKAIGDGQVLRGSTAGKDAFYLEDPVKYDEEAKERKKDISLFGADLPHDRFKAQQLTAMKRAGHRTQEDFDQAGNRWRSGLNLYHDLLVAERDVATGKIVDIEDQLEEADARVLQLQEQALDAHMNSIKHVHTEECEHSDRRSEKAALIAKLLEQGSDAISLTAEPITGEMYMQDPDTGEYIKVTVDDVDINTAGVTVQEWRSCPPYWLDHLIHTGGIRA